MKQLDEYSQDELIALLKRLSVYATIWWFKYYRMYKMKDEDKDKPIIDHYDSSQLDVSFRVLACVKTEWTKKERISEILQQTLRNNVIDRQLHELRESGAEKNRSEIKKLVFEKTAYLCVHNGIWWFGGGFEDYSNRLYDSLVQQEGYDAWLSPDEMEEELHSGDELNIENGVATDIQVYQFVWETLQYLDIKQLGKLLKFADTGIEKKWQNITIGAGRRDKVAEIQQIDIETGNVVATYMMRKDIIAKTGIKKSHLAQCIKTAKDNPGNRNEWKKWKGSDGKLYGFAESQ